MSSSQIIYILVFDNEADHQHGFHTQKESVFTTDQFDRVAYARRQPGCVIDFEDDKGKKLTEKEARDLVSRREANSMKGSPLDYHKIAMDNPEYMKIKNNLFYSGIAVIVASLGLCFLPGFWSQEHVTDGAYLLFAVFLPNAAVYILLIVGLFGFFRNSSKKSQIEDKYRPRV